MAKTLQEDGYLGGVGRTARISSRVALVACFAACLKLTRFRMVRSPVDLFDVGMSRIEGCRYQVLYEGVGCGN